MNPNVLRRFVVYLVVATVVMFTIWTFFGETMKRAPGDFETEMGGNRLQDGLHEEALAHFDKALSEMPNHRGALMGRALVFIAREEYDLAITELSYLINFLKDNLEADDKTGQAALAAAYANRGIVHDRQARYEKAFEDYVQALRVDEEAVEGPDWIDKILYENTRPSNVRKRARYIQEQLKLPPEQRKLSIPELDAKERPYKPR